MDAAVEERPFLSEATINHLCRPLTQKAAKVRFLRSLGLHVTETAGGEPHVATSEYERVFGAARMAPMTKKTTAAPGGEPDTAAALALLSQRKGRNGSQTRGR